MTTGPTQTRSGSPGTGTWILGGLVLLLVAGIAAVLLLGSPAPSASDPSPSQSGSTPPSQSAQPTEAPASSSPTSTPASGELPTGPADAVMSFRASCDVVPPVNVPSTTVLTDGRVIWGTDDGRLVVRQLTSASLDDFTEQVRSTGLFEQSGTYDLERRPGTAEPPGHGLCIWRFTWNDGADDVEVVSVMWLGDQEESTYYEPAPERRTLHDLATQLQDPTTWYGNDGWVQAEAVPYEPEEYLVLVMVGPAQMATLGAPDFGDVSWPFDEPPDEFGVEYGTGTPTGRCDVATADAIATLAAELSAAGLEQFDEGKAPFFGAGAALPWEAQNAAVDMSFWPVLPDGRPSCDEDGS